MVKINRVHMNYENPLIGAEEMPQFGWEIESSKRDVVQKSYQRQISENEKFKELVYNSGLVCSEESSHTATGREIAVSQKIFCTREDSRSGGNIFVE